MSDSTHILGADIGAEFIELCGAQGLPLPPRIPNTAKACASLIRKLQAHARKAHPDHPQRLHIICEATGGHERHLLKACWTAGVAVSRINPTRVRDFARSKGLLAKTDKIDARTLRDFGSLLSPAPTPEPSASQTALAELVTRRQELIEIRTAEKNRLRLLDNPQLQRLGKTLLANIQNQIQQIEKLIEATIANDPLLNARSLCLQQTQGVGPTVAAALLAYLPELGSIPRNAAAALAGVAPFNRDSGSLRGKRSIRGGRPKARKALYMAALVASRYNAILRAFYSQLISRGKAPKVALTALMRKLLIHLNSSLKSLTSPC